MSDLNTSPQEALEPVPAPVESPPSSSTEETPTEPEAPAEAASPASDADDGDGDEGDGEETSEAPGRGRNRSGYKRKVARLEREKAQLLDMLQRSQPQAAQPVAQQRKATPEEELEGWVQQRIQQTLSQERVRAESQRLRDDLAKQMADAAARYEDFEDVVNSAPMPPPAVQEAILTSEHKAEIMYSLAKNPAELARISALPPLQAALAIGRLEAKLASGATQRTPTPKPAARPPKPIVPVSTRGPTTVKRTEDMSYDEYVAWRKQGGGR